MDGYPVVWRGQTYTLTDLTVGIKRAFVKCAKRSLTADGIENLGHRLDLLDSYLANLYAECWWGDVGASKPVHSYLNSEQGGLEFNRLLFGDSVKVLSDSDLQVMLDEKEADPKSDYMVAMKLIKAASSPKAVSGPAPTGGTSSTGTTEPSPSTRAGTNSTG